MLTREQVLNEVKSGRESECLDGRDYARLCAFFPVEDWDILGRKLKEGVEAPPALEWTRENVIERMSHDLEFSFTKALNRRGISASLMYATMKTWMWVLEDPLKDHDDYPMYGLPLFKAIAVKYGLPNPIGDDTGSEAHYNSDDDEYDL